MYSSDLHAGPRLRAEVTPKPHHVLTSAVARAAISLGLVALALITLAPVSEAVTPPDSTGFAFITNVTFGSGAALCPGEPVVMTVSGTVPGCMRFAGLRILPTAGPLTVVAARVVDLSCVADCLPGSTDFSASIDLGVPFPGLFHVQLAEAKSACPDSTQTAELRSRLVDYVVRPECPPPPPPSLDSLVRSFTALRVVPERPCATDTVRLELVKNGCTPCLHLTSFALTRVRGLVATLDWAPQCAEFRCAAETLSVSIGLLRAGFYRFEIATDVHVLGSPDSTISFTRAVEFPVLQLCDTLSHGCLEGALPPFGVPLPQCSALIRPGASGDAVLPIRTAVPAAGVEGFLASVAPFRVTNVTYAGSAPGVQVSWRHDGELTRFVVFSTHGVAVPTGLSSLLRVRLAADSSLTAGPESGRLQGVVTLAADVAGDEIALCPQPAFAPPALTICLDRSELSGCDVNADGHTDVRDLVRMATCLRVPAPGDPRCYDCDRDSVFGISDLICCARVVLGGGGVPGDSAVVHEGLMVSIDPPLAHAHGNGFALRVHVSGADALGAALLRVRYPAERWRVTTPEVFADYFAAGWMPLIEQTEAGLLRLGALRLSERADGELVYELDAVPIAGAAEGDALVVEGADLTSPSGAVYLPSVALPRTELSPTLLSATVELSPARPNPFGRATSFSVRLPREAMVELTVHDVTGRTVARLAQGRMSAGRRSFTWDASGARDGMYFVRLVVDGTVRSTRVALLRDGR